MNDGASQRARKLSLLEHYDAADQSELQANGTFVTDLGVCRKLPVTLYRTKRSTSNVKPFKASGCILRN